jgi:oxaloacetate decarboxylase gamma subunit
MTIVQMLGQSGYLTVLGMGIVFFFLVILIVSITLVGKLLKALGVDKDPEEAPRVSAPAAGPSNNAAVTAAISAAVTEYRANQ